MVQFFGEQIIKGQLSEAYGVLEKHAKRLQEDYGVTQIELFYEFLAEIYNDPSTLAEARKFLGTEPMRVPEWEKNTDKRDIETEFRAAELYELNITLEYNK